MAKIAIIKNDVPVRCDLFRCNEVATHRVAIPGESYATHILFCEDCLKNLYLESAKLFGPIEEESVEPVPKAQTMAQTAPLIGKEVPSRNGKRSKS